MAGEIRAVDRLACGTCRYNQRRAGEARPASRRDHASRGESGEPVPDPTGAPRELQRVRHSLQPRRHAHAVFLATDRGNPRQPAEGAERGRAATMIGRSRWVGYALLSPALVAVGFLIGYPLYLVITTSFRQGKTLDVLRLSALPAGLGNYRTVLGSEATWHSVGVTLVYLVGTIGPAFAIGLLTALLLNRAFPGRRWLRSFILLPWAVPGVIVSIVFLWLLDGSFGVVNALLRQAGWLSTDLAWFANDDTALGAVIVATVWKAYPFFTLTLLAALQAIPATLYEAARVDGATAWQRFRHISWPGIRAAAVLAAILNTLWALREFDIIYVTTGGGPDRATETLAVRIYQEAFAFFRMGTASALGVMTMVFAALLALASMRTLRREYF
ncbi:MAG: sugar ABC transporter permease [Betaproteobacteria bacterium]|nr:MAG: sugar ABC transporter permease [Betaproteobacteria bacterium]